MTTAELRRLAADAEIGLDWFAAAHYWDAAADAYPEMLRAGALAERDIAKMRERAQACRDYAKHLFAMDAAE